MSVGGSRSRRTPRTAPRSAPAAPAAPARPRAPASAPAQSADGVGGAAPARGRRFATDAESQAEARDARAAARAARAKRKRGADNTAEMGGAVAARRQQANAGPAAPRRTLRGRRLGGGAAAGGAAGAAAGPRAAGAAAAGPPPPLAPGQREVHSRSGHAFRFQHSPPLEYRDAQMQVRSERVALMHNPDRVSLGAPEVLPVASGERPAVVVPVTNRHTGETLRVATTHAPFRDADGSATTYAGRLMRVAQQQNVDVVMGDLNRYSTPSSARAQRGPYTHVSAGGTSRGGAPLDQVHVRNELAARATAGRPDLAAGAAAPPPGTLRVGSWNLQGQGALGPGALAEHSEAQGWDLALFQEPSAFSRRPTAAPTRRSTRRPARITGAANPSDHHPIYLQLAPPEGEANPRAGKRRRPD